TAVSGKATLGICLGAQAMARGAGAENTLGSHPEFGWCQIALTDQGRADPVLGLLPPQFPIFEWHSDHFTLPPEAVHLATNPSAQVQSYRIGRAGYATQFHFEASRAVVADWVRRFPDLIEQQSPGFTATLIAEAEAKGRAADAHGLAIARAWVALI
ncbi:MAG: GMP synthase, partial [Rhodobacterales bacterium 17-64-5]